MFPARNGKTFLFYLRIIRQSLFLDLKLATKTRSRPTVRKFMSGTDTAVEDWHCSCMRTHLKRSEEHTSELHSQFHLLFLFFFFNDTATTEIYPLSLHDALPISTVRKFMSGTDTAVEDWHCSCMRTHLK